MAYEVRSGIEEVPRSVWAVGLSTFLINISTALVFALSTCFMRTILNIDPGNISLIQSFVDALSQFLKLISGILSDFFRRRKIIVLIGFSLIALAKPFIALSTTAFLVFIARSIDRVGNGIQSAPRDALIGDIAPSRIRGRCFGIRQALAVAGSFFGGVLGITLMKLTKNNYEFIFYLASIPCVLAIIIFSFFVKDVPITRKSAKYSFPISIENLKRLGKPYFCLLFVILIFMLARFGGESPLILNAQIRFGLPDEYSNIILILYNGMNSLVSYPVGLLSDRIGRKHVLSLGFIILMLSDVFLATSKDLLTMFIGVGLWGAQIGITQSMFVSLITDLVPPELKATALGLFYFITSFIILIAGYSFKISLAFGNMASAFWVSFFISLIALLTFTFLFRKYAKPH